MKTLISFLSFSLFALAATGQTKIADPLKPDPAKKLQVVEAACGECKLGLSGKSCDLAIRIDGKAYFVDGTDIDSHGDAHAKDGFCKAIRMAEVQGEIKDGRFKATYFKLISSPGKNNVKTIKTRN
jgi:hypothetical protein